jgi:hypothetical protein
MTTYVYGKQTVKAGGGGGVGVSFAFLLRGFSDGFASVSGLPCVRAPCAKPSMLRKTIHC